MKTRLKNGRQHVSGYALAVVLVIAACSLLILASTIKRTSNVAYLNERNNMYIANLNAAEAATEKAYALMSFDFQGYGPGQVASSLDRYRTNIPSNSDNPYFTNFVFSDGSGNANKTYVQTITNNYNGPLPSQYPGLFAVGSPIYRIMSNVKTKSNRITMTNAVQEDILLALVPITTYAIFYNSLLEFSTCATMVVNGRVHANGNIYVGAGDSATLTFNTSVTSTGTLGAPANNGSSWGSGTGWRTTFNGTPNYRTNVPNVALSINMTNTHSMIEMPAAGETLTNAIASQRLYNQAHIVIIVTNGSVTVRLQTPPSAGQLPAADSSPVVLTSTLTNSAVTNKFPFMTITNFVVSGTNTNSVVFYDKREDKTNVLTTIDMGKLNTWLTLNTNATSKFSSTTPATILYVADNRSVNSKQQTAVRLTNGTVLPRVSARGFSVATPNPLYVLGNYNATNNSALGTTNTSATVPAALMSDALTILSSAWKDADSTDVYTDRDAAETNTVNAAIITGIVPSTGTSSTTFSGGVHNLPRLLEDWSGSHLWLNTSIVNLFISTKATGKFVNPGTYYSPPTRHFSFDVNFLDPNKQPPGVPCALLAIRYNWAVPPANTPNYNVTP